MSAIQDAEASSAAYLSPRQRMQMMKESLLKDEAKEGSKPWEQSRITKKTSRYLEINTPTSYRDRPAPSVGILRRPSAASFAESENSLSPLPSPYSPSCSDFGPPAFERRPSKVRFTLEKQSNSLPNLKRLSSVDALRADLDRAKASLSGAFAASMNELTDLENSLRRLTPEEFDEAFKPQPLRLPRMCRALATLSGSSYDSEIVDDWEPSAPSRPPKSPLRHSISASAVGTSSSGPSRSVSLSTLSASSSSYSPGSRSTSTSSASSASYGLPRGSAYQHLLPRSVEEDNRPSPSLSHTTSVPSTPHTPTLNRSGWTGDEEISPRSTPQATVPTVEVPAPVAPSTPSSTHSRSSSWSLTGLDFPVPPERVFNYGKMPKLLEPAESPLGETAIVEETPSTNPSPETRVVELPSDHAEEPLSVSIQERAVSSFESSSEHEGSPAESPIITPSESSPLSSARRGDIYSVPLSFTSLDRSDPMSMTLLEAAVEFDIVSRNSSLLKPSKGKSRSVKIRSEEDEDDGWMGSDAEEEEYFKAVRVIANHTPKRPSPESDPSRLSRISQISSTSISTVASTSELLTPLPSSSELPTQGNFPARSSEGSPTPGNFAWGKHSPAQSPILRAKKSLPYQMAPTAPKPVRKWPKPALDIDWGPPEVLYDAMDWVWRPQDDSDEASPIASTRVTPRGSRSRPSAADEMEDLRNVSTDDMTPRAPEFGRVPSPPLRMPEGVEEWLMDEQEPHFHQGEVGIAM